MTPTGVKEAKVDLIAECGVDYALVYVRRDQRLEAV